MKWNEISFHFISSIPFVDNKTPLGFYYLLRFHKEWNLINQISFLMIIKQPKGVFYLLPPFRVVVIKPPFGGLITIQNHQPLGGLWLLLINSKLIN